MMLPAGVYAHPGGRIPMMPPMIPLPPGHGHGHGMVQPLPPRHQMHPPGVQMIVNRGGGPPVPNSFVPMQVTRQKTVQQHQPKSGQSTKKLESKSAQDAAPSALQVSASSDEESKQTSTAQVVSTPERVAERVATVPSTSKPPGSRLAIRFNGP